jgi:hypothetical protein
MSHPGSLGKNFRLWIFQSSNGLLKNFLFGVNMLEVGVGATLEMLHGIVAIVGKRLTEKLADDGRSVGVYFVSLSPNDRATKGGDLIACR